MALQGNLRDFSTMEILQLVGSQKKSGCLVMEWNTERFPIWVIEGRIVATRDPGLPKDDPLARFLRQVKRLSEEQLAGLAIIQKESGRDLEDLLVNGRYVEPDDLAPLVERQILDDLMRVVRWEHGTYRFEPNAVWPGDPVVALGMEATLIEAARRVDEQKRFMAAFRDPHRLLAVHDLPNPDEELSEEERELFGIVDGRRTVAQVVAAAPLSEYEAYESLHRMLEAHWIQFTGRRDPGLPSIPVPARPRVEDAHRVPAWLREIGVAVAVLAVVALVHLVAARVTLSSRIDHEHDVYALARLRDLRQAVELFARDRGSYPRNLEDLVDDRWIEPAELKVPGYTVQYAVSEGGADFQLTLAVAR